MNEQAHCDPCGCPPREKEKYYVWRSDTRDVESIEAASAEAAADIFATRYHVPYVTALRVVAVRDVRSFEIRVKG